ncbi:hypothetical protein A2442_03995 [Candidatus Campbellbacteria bacterium RIFOXYC2_FULL_35_25]|uniref:DUF342 domain-containing protein n=1 Tax=Candidatus Campbellbacteria bacterium RIFOXYC2_FULL_35_25 TaxID=1797582 RepID=A0A1F5EJW2_9BACT|nr:MAG: hypothetical protein A2442_03995 [Candidatus Campbellbacteria bacterium RIFOXYC2_FULL_35_25]
MQIKKAIYLILALTFAFFATAGSTQAADFRAAAKNGGNVTVSQEEQITNLYTAGNVISVDANIEKGLHAVGNILNINGNVGQSIYSGAGTLLIKGDVGGSVHGGGGNIVIEGKITDDLILGGGNISISSKASVGGDLVAGGGVVDIQGPVTGNIYLSGGVLTINSEIGGNVKIDKVDEIRLGSNAVIKGNLEYYSTKEIVMDEGAVVLGETIINEKGAGKHDLDKGALAGFIFAIISVALLIKLIGMIIVALFFAYLFKKFTTAVVKESITSFWKSLGTGFAVLILVPIIMVILMITVVGIWLGLIVLTIYLSSIIIASALAGVTFGSWLILAITKKDNYSVNWKTILWGSVVLTIIGILPVIGWLIVLILILINLGSIYQVFFRMHK